MPVLPQGDIQKVEFMEAHLTLWNTNAVAIGLTVAQVTAMSTATTAARSGYNTMLVKREDAKSATAGFHNLARSMTDLASDAVKAIKTKAAQTNDPNVFVLANIPAPDAASPPPPVVPPTELVADPNADGTVTLKWKGTTAFNTWFSVWRKIGSAAWDQIGSTGIKTFVDSSVPGEPIPSVITYACRSQRGNEISALSVQAEVVYGGPGQNFTSGVAGFVGSGDGGTQQEAA